MNTQACPDLPQRPLPSMVSDWLEVGDGHRLYFEQCGQAAGLPVVYLHGGPGGACSPRHRELFDLTGCRLTLFDQRGCGRSEPRGALHANTSEHLVADIERLRQRLGIARWLVAAGSWGAGLALAYAAAHPSACLGLVLRGVFLGRVSDLDWFFQQASQLLPDAWEVLARQAPPAARGDLLAWLHAGLHGNQPQVALSRAIAWDAWEASMSQHRSAAPRAEPLPAEDAAALLDKYRLQSHYLTNGCFWGDAPLLARAPALAWVPTAIVHGRQDWICRPEAAWALHMNLPNSRLQWLDGCAHGPFEAAMAQALRQAVSHFAGHGNFAGWADDFSGAATP